jgi:uncharacterized protein YjbJ (UPF0337 family)
MGELGDKAKGVGNEIAGKVKQGIGKATDDPLLHQEGVAQERRGEGQNLKGEVKGKLGDKI